MSNKSQISLSGMLDLFITLCAYDWKKRSLAFLAIKINTQPPEYTKMKLVMSHLLQGSRIGFIAMGCNYVLFILRKIWSTLLTFR